jgi:protoheme IX farnesyltransferase
LNLISLQSFLSLIRFNVSLAVTFTAYATALICRKSFSWLDILPMSGIFLLAAGASVLNQYQESEYDAKMSRTDKRPVSSGMVKPETASILAIIFILTGLTLISTRELWLTMMLGLFNVLWYNGFYTWLKRKTPFAVVPGALTGAIPVLMGWTAAGGSINHPLPLFLAFFIFLWQVPHFWLLSIIYEEDYRNAGFPVLTDIFKLNQMKKIIFAWLLATSLSTILMMFFKILHQNFTVTTILILNLVLLYLSAHILFFSRKSGYRLQFHLVNIFIVLVFCVIVADSLLHQ